jgi:GNAT superfamily N-acetyltransferase
VEKHFRCVELPISIDEFHRLPRNAAYKYEYWDGRAVLTPRPKSFTCARDLSPVIAEPRRPVEVRPLPAADIPGLVEPFFRSFRQIQPFGSLDNDAAQLAATECLEKTATGGDGPVIEAACCTAWDERHDAHPAGAILMTLVPPAALTDPFWLPWKEPPADAVALRLGVPHVTWVFVDSWHTRRGIGSALLAASVNALREAGFTDVASTFALDNAPSALWHWRHGFRLLPQLSAFMRQKD